MISSWLDRLDFRQRGLWVLLCAVLIVDLSGLGWGLPNTLAPHPDDVAKPALEAMQQRFLEPTKYPKVQLLWVAATYAPYLALLWSRGELHLGGDSAASSQQLLDDPVRVLSNLLYLARLSEVLAHLLAVLAVYLLAHALARERRGALLAAALFAFSPWIVFFTKTSTVDVPLTFWLAASLLAAAAVWSQPSARRLAAFSCLCILAVCTKEQAAFYLCTVCLALGARVLLQLGVAKGLARAAPGLIVALLLYALLNDLLWAPQVFAERWGAWGADLSGWRDEVMASPGALQLLSETLSYCAAVLGPGLLVAGLWSVVVCVRARSRLGMLLIAQLVAYPLLLVSYLGFVQPRYMIPQALTLALLCALAWKLSSRTSSKPRTLAALALVVFAVLQASLIDMQFLNDPRSQATRWLSDHAALGTELEYHQKINSLPGVRAAGLVPVHVSASDLESFAQRRPEWVCIVGNERWNWNPAQLAFAERLMFGDVHSLGYSRVHFGRKDPNDTRWYLPHDLNSRLRPEVVLLQRVD